MRSAEFAGGIGLMGWSVEELGDVGRVPGTLGSPGFLAPRCGRRSWAPAPDGPSAESAVRGFHVETPPERQDASSALTLRRDSLPVQLSCLTSLGRAGRMSPWGSDLQRVEHKLAQLENGAQWFPSLARAGRPNISSCVGSVML